MDAPRDLSAIEMAIEVNRAIDSLPVEVRNHNQRAAVYAVAIGAELGLHAEELREMRLVTQLEGSAGTGLAMPILDPVRSRLVQLSRDFDQLCLSKGRRQALEHMRTLGLEAKEMNAWEAVANLINPVT